MFWRDLAANVAGGIVGGVAAGVIVLVIGWRLLDIPKQRRERDERVAEQERQRADRAAAEELKRAERTTIYLGIMLRELQYNQGVREKALESSSLRLIERSTGRQTNPQGVLSRIARKPVTTASPAQMTKARSAVNVCRRNTSAAPAAARKPTGAESENSSNAIPGGGTTAPESHPPASPRNASEIRNARPARTNRTKSAFCARRA